MMRRVLPVLLLALPLTLAAQVRIGFLSYGGVMSLMPEYAQAQEELAQLKLQYDDEAVRGEEEFRRKFAEFLQGQKDFPQNILLKRQAELQSLMENGISFRNEARQLLDEAERELLAEVSAKLNDAIREVGQEGSFLLILNTDGNQCPFLSPDAGEDVTHAVLQKLGLAEQEQTLSAD